MAPMGWVGGIIRPVTGFTARYQSLDLPNAWAARGSEPFGLCARRRNARELAERRPADLAAFERLPHFFQHFERFGDAQFLERQVGRVAEEPFDVFDEASEAELGVRL